MRHIFIDTNIFIYASGDPHPHKEPSARILEKAAVNQIKVVSNAEVLQEILHYYWAKKDKLRGFRIIEKIIEIIPLILPVNKNDILKAKELLDKYSQIEPRDAIHTATMLNRGIKTIYTYDKHYDQIREIKRLSP
jgi:predicted nucleic acid-binding protein